MKRILSSIALAGLMVFSTAANAQDAFYPGFQWGVKGGVGYTVGGTSNFGKYISPSAGIDLGYQFTPVFTLRADIAGWQGKGAFLGNFWSMDYAHLAADAVFDIGNMVRFKSDRVVNPYFFAGIGAHMRFNNKADNSSPSVTIPYDNYYWDGTKLSYVGRLGVGVNFRVSDQLGIFVEVADNATDDHFNSKKGEVFDQQITGMVGLKFTFGQARKARAAAAAKAEAERVAAERAAAERAEAERIAAERAAAAKAEAERVAAERVAAERAEAERIAAERAAAEAAEKAAIYSKEGALDAASEAVKDENNDIFFTSEKHGVAASARAKIDALVEKLNANPDAKVVICAFADKATGTPDYNMTLSEKRAASVAKALEAKGIDKSRIITWSYGDTAQPMEISRKNRACVMICK